MFKKNLDPTVYEGFFVDDSILRKLYVPIRMEKKIENVIVNAVR